MKTPSRLVRTTLASAIAVTTLAVTAPQASAADNWRTVNTHAGGLVQACKVPVSGGYNVKVRLNNRAGTHGHLASAYYGGKTISFKAGKGVVTPLNRLYRVPSTGKVSTQIGHTYGGEAGGAFPVTWLYTC